MLQSYRIVGSNCRMIAAVPSEAPELWAAYLEGAMASYRKFGVENALELDEIRDGTSTSLFLVAVTPDGEVVGGVRAQGPYAVAEQAHAIQEWEGCEGQDDVRQMVADRIADGVVEMKTAWVSDRSPDRKALTQALARIPLVAVLDLLDVRYVMATAGTDPVIKLWLTTGGEIATHIPTAPYPSDRYHATLIWWDREALTDLQAA
ncbi:hypothetical protein [Antrihabitans stalactiti]|nr:hypothetical protein [Antrihabitans stalactiti]